MNIQPTITRILGITLIAGLCATPEMMQAASAQQNTQTAAPQPTNTQSSNTNPTSDQSTQTSTQAAGDQSQAQTNPQTKPQARGTTVDPSQAPLQPVTTYPGA